MKILFLIIKQKKIDIYKNNSQNAVASLTSTNAIQWTLKNSSTSGNIKNQLNKLEGITIPEVSHFANVNNGVKKAKQYLEAKKNIEGLPNGAQFKNNNKFLSVRNKYSVIYGNKLNIYNKDKTPIGTLTTNNNMKLVYTPTTGSKNLKESQKTEVAPKKNSAILNKIPPSVEYTVLKFGTSTRSPNIFLNTNIKKYKFDNSIKGY